MEPHATNVRRVLARHGETVVVANRYFTGERSRYDERETESQIFKTKAAANSASPDSVRDVGGTEQEYDITFYLSTDEKPTEDLVGRGADRDPSFLVRGNGQTYTVAATDTLGDGILIVNALRRSPSPPEGIPKPSEVSDKRAYPYAVEVEVTTPTPEVNIG